MAEKIRVLVAKPGLDGHDLGAKYVARTLREAGMEVIYTGLQQSAEQIAAAALQEDVNVIGCSILSGAHLGTMAKVMKKLKDAGVAAPVIVGGCIPRADIAELKRLGVAEVFPTDSPPQAIVAFIKQRVNG